MEKTEVMLSLMLYHTTAKFSSLQWGSLNPTSGWNKAAKPRSGMEGVVSVREGRTGRKQPGSGWKGGKYWLV